jgi:hypothetical protein
MEEFCLTPKTPPWFGGITEPQNTGVEEYWSDGAMTQE